MGDFRKMTSDNNPLVSIIVPARNEEASLAACLDSLVTQTGTSYEIIVVDDDSTDRTAEIAQSFHGVKLIPAGPLPVNWTGKNNAMSAGAKVARAKWLLFTDADTVHLPGSLARAVAEADQHGAALLSYSPAQEVHGFWEKAVMPVIFAELATTYPPQAVNDPTSPIAAANGQYLMISREAYDAVGGHTAVARDLLEDVAMARIVKRSGRKIFFRYAPDAVRTRMYRSFAQLREGWTKNLALLFPKPVELAQQRFGEFALLLILLWMLARGTYWRVFSSALYPVWIERYVATMVVLTCVASVLSTVEFVKRIRRAHFPPWTTVWAIFGLPVFGYLLLRSERTYKKSRFDWKDRTYIYTPEEVEALTAARSSSETPSTWHKLTGWFSNIGRT